MSFTNRTRAALDQEAPTDWVAGEDLGATLYPASLRAAQLGLRRARERLSCAPW